MFTTYSRLAAACPHKSSVFEMISSSEETAQRLPRFLCYIYFVLKLNTKKVRIIKEKWPTLPKMLLRNPIIPYQQEMGQESFQMMFVMQLFRFLWNKCCQQILFFFLKVINKENKKEAIWNFSFFCEDGMRRKTICDCSWNPMPQ